jgi:uncharacterized protein (TIGR02001 family)
MNKLKMALMAALALPSLSAVAEEEAKSEHSVSYNVGLFSQYIFRGYNQTDGRPALQGGIDYEHSSGFYLGAWGSNVSWTTDDFDSGSGTSPYKSGGTLEIDLYGGYANEIGETGIGYDVGVLQFLYPGEVRSGYAKANTTEVYGGLNYKWLSYKAYVVTSEDAWTWGKSNNDGDDSARGSLYQDLTAEIPLGDLVDHKLFNGVTATLHYGYQEFAGKNNRKSSYGDWKLGLDKEFADGINVGWYYTGTDYNKRGWSKQGGEYLPEDTNTFYVTKSF